MIKEIFPGLYKLEIPLPDSPLKVLNSYVILDKERNLVIDTGMNRDECLSVMHGGLKELGVDLAKTDFFITHMHVDHSGLVCRLVTETSRIYCSEPDSGLIVSTYLGGNFQRKMAKIASSMGFPEGIFQRVLMEHPGDKYSAKGQLDFTFVKEGDIISAGNYTFTCLETPGHTPGHLCLYEAKEKLLLSGDLILEDITPNISFWKLETGNPLKDFINSLQKVSELEIRVILPGHRELIINDCQNRINQLKEHCRDRSGEVLAILRGNGCADAYDVASQMNWNITYTSWELFPAMQQWFAAGEALSYLNFLEREGLVRMEDTDRREVFYIK